MNRDEKFALKWLLIIFAIALVFYFFTKLVDAITHPSIVWFVIGLLSALVIEGIAWCIYRLKWRTWQFWRKMPVNKESDQ